MISDELLISYNRRGLFPGIKECETAFFERVSRFQAVLQTASIPLYNVFPDWVSVAYGKEGLSFWEGGATWIDKDSVHIQIKKKSLLGLYSQQEILDHELSHAARSSFDEPIFEEFFAYKTSKKRWRRFLGPIFRTPWESYLFLGTLFLSLWGGFWMLPFFGLLLFAFYRLFRGHWVLNRCVKNLTHLLKNEDIWPFLFRLTDEEILLIRRSSTEEIKNYIELQKTHSMRWKIIALAYYREESRSQ